MLRFIVLLPILLVLASFALSSVQRVAFGLWPIAGTIELRATLAVLFAGGIGFLGGALMLWPRSLAARRRAARAERKLAALGASPPPAS